MGWRLDPFVEIDLHVELIYRSVFISVLEGSQLNCIVPNLSNFELNVRANSRFSLHERKKFNRKI